MTNQPSILQRLLSWVWPQRLRKASSELNPVLELLYYNGRYQLATEDALYSDGNKYRPLVTAFRELKDFLPGIKKVLVLGAGLGSAVTLLRKQGLNPEVTLVELDPVVLSWAVEILDEKPPQLQAVVANAEEFMAGNRQQCDLVIVDVFQGRNVPDFVLSETFLRQCRAALHPGGRLILNYMVRWPEEVERPAAAIKAVFGSSRVISFGLNRVFVVQGEI